MKIIYCVYVLLLFVSLNLFGSTNSQTAIILDDTSDQLDKYPTSSSLKTCAYKFNVLVTLQTPGTYDAVSFTTTYPSITLGFYPLYSNYTSGISQLSISNVPYGSHSIPIQITYQNGFLMLEVVLRCYQYNISSYNITNSTRDKTNGNPLYILEAFEVNNASFNNFQVSDLYTARKTSIANVYILEPTLVSATINQVLNDFSIGLLFDQFNYNISINKFLNTNDESTLLSIYLPFNRTLFYIYNPNTRPLGFLSFISNSRFPFIKTISSVDSSNVRIISGDGNGNFTYIAYSGSGECQMVLQNLNILNRLSFSTNLISNYNPGNDIMLHLVSIDTVQLKLIASVKFTNSSLNLNYNFDMFTIKNKLFEMKYRFPFGFSFGNNKNYINDVGLILPTYSSTGTETIFVCVNPFQSPLFYSTTTINIQQFSTIPPQLIDYKIDYLDDFLMVLSIHIVDSSDIGGIYINDIHYYNYDSLVDGGSTDAYIEIIYNIVDPFKKLTLLGPYGEYISYQVGDYYQLSQNAVIKDLDFSSSNVFKIQQVSFKFNHIDITNRTIPNIIYFTIQDAPKNVSIKFQLLDDVSIYRSYNSIEHLQSYYSYWNSTINQFQVEFFIPENTVGGIIPFKFISPNGDYYHSQFLPDDQQLYVTSKNIDVLGPIITFIKPNYDWSDNGGITWDFVINDRTNGFKSGFIQIRAQYDSSTYNFTFDSNSSISGDKWNGTYRINLKLNGGQCYTQNYTIYLIELYDTANMYSKYSNYPGQLHDPSINVFHNYEAFSQNDLSELSYQFECGIYDDNAPPSLLNFSVYEVVYSKKLQFNFSILSNVAIKENQLPIVYLTNTQFDLLECASTLVVSFSKIYNYSCEIELPFGRAFSNEYYFSIYGIITSGGYYFGYSTLNLKSSGFQYSFLVRNIDLKSIVLTSTSLFSSSGGKLIVRGRGFNKDLGINFNFKSGSQFIRPDKQFKTAMLFYNVPSSFESFTISTSYSNGTAKSNEIQVNPIIYNYTDPHESSSSSSSSSSSDNLPENKPQECLDNCGGKERGYCSSSGCVCFSPYEGIDCGSSIIFIPAPSMNQSDPSIEIPVNQNKAIFKSLISLHSIRELDINQNQVNILKFEKWTHKQINELTSQYNTVLSNQVNVVVTIQFFNEKTNISFANQQFQMNPSSIKYSVSISKYPFVSDLNSLQLVMSAQVESNNNKVCSVKNYGETSNGENSDYVKIQVDNISLYGRFIKRGIIDSKVSSISNTLLDSQLNSINSNSKSQSFIGINIRHFNQDAIIDPDWSVLLDNKNAKDKLNSICSKSKLSSSQIAGIVIGSFGFALVISISFVYYYYKKKRNLQIIKNMQNKLKEFNNKQ